MLDKFAQIRQKLYIARKVKKSLAVIEQELIQFKGSKVLAVCPATTGNSWQGIWVATRGLFDKSVFVLPQYYSQSIYSKSELVSIGNMLADTNSDEIIFSGYLSYFDTLIDQIHKRGKRVSIIYHGSHTSVLEDPNAATHFKSFLMLASRGCIAKVGFVKKDLDKTMHRLTGLRCFPILLKTEIDVLNIKPNKLSGTNIGVLTHSEFRKNIYNQVSAALMVEGARVHMKQQFLSGYLGNEDKRVFHGYAQDRASFLHLLGSMTLNLYVTFSECWGQFVNESLAMGVPCLTSDVSAVLDFDTEIKQRLIVHELDNDYAIYLKIMEVLEDVSWYEENGPKYVRRLNDIAEKTFNNFINH